MIAFSLVIRSVCKVLLVCGSAITAFAGPAVSKVEPPFWWVQHSLNPVRLLIRGSGLAGAAVTPPAGFTADNIAVNRSGTYLFVDLTIPPSAQPGRYPLTIGTSAGEVQAPFQIEAALDPADRFAGFSSDDVIYLIMPDRFANGDPRNDDPPISRGAFGRNQSRLYHGGDLQGVIDRLPYLKDLGITALWLTPIYDNTNETYTSEFAAGARVSDYHGYGAIDYYGVDEHFGDLDLLKKLVDAAHREGIKVIQDQVANHVSPVHPWVKDSPTPTWFHGTGAKHFTETFHLWNLIDPYASPELFRPVFDGWFGNFLPDMNQEDPEAARYEIQNALWWVGAAGFDGIRQDTLPYVARTFWADWSAALKRQYPKLRVVGEVLDPNPAITSFFQTGAKRLGHESNRPLDSGIDTVFDYPTYFSIRDTIARGKKLEDLVKTMASDQLYPDAGSLVTILGDHDVARFLEEPGATIDRLKLAFTFLLTARGTPVIYYGDEVAMRGGEDPDNRRDFPGGWHEDRRRAFESQGRTPEESAVFDHVKKLNALRKQESSLRRGHMMNLAETEQAWAYARENAGSAVIVALNNGSKETVLSFTGNLPPGTYRDAIGAGSPIAISGGSTVTLKLPAVGAAVYVRR